MHMNVNNGASSQEQLDGLEPYLAEMFLAMSLSVPINSNVVSSNTAHGEVYFIQHYMIKFVSDLRQVGGFLMVPIHPVVLEKKFVLHISHWVAMLTYVPCWWPSWIFNRSKK
jgi:hypothetical protein